MIYSNRQETIFTSTCIPFKKLYHGFGSKLLGDGRDISVLERYLESQSISYRNLVQPHQTHSTHVQTIAGIFSDKVVNIPDCDGIITREKNVVLSVVTADCVPIIFYDPVEQIIGISHQGWKGTTNRLPEHMIGHMKRVGSRPADIICTMGPAINTCCYHMNLYQMNRETLLSAGISREHIDIFPFCTSCDAARFFSYRREGKINGEMIHFVMMS